MADTPKLSTWKPIDDAAKDGSYFLLWSPMWDDSWGVQKGHFEGDGEGGGIWVTSEGEVSDNGLVVTTEDEIDDEDDLDWDYGPTHYMEIPPTPSQTGEDHG